MSRYKYSLFLLVLLSICQTDLLLAANKKVIVIGFDGMDPRLATRMMDAGDLPHFDGLRKAGGYRPLATSNPPQSPVAWASFITGAGPGSHGIFDFIHRNPERQAEPFYSSAETVTGEGAWEVGDHKLQLPFWPFNHIPTVTLLRRNGIPFWDYLDEAGITSKFYDIPANYPPSQSRHGHHCCLSGMGTPDLLGSYGTYQHFSEDGPIRMKHGGASMKSMLFFEDEQAKGVLYGPDNDMMKKPEPVTIEFMVYRDLKADAAAIEIQDHRILLKAGQWSDWLQLEFKMSTPWVIGNNVSGICRFYLQEVQPELRLYVTPINIDPSKPAVIVSEPESLVTDLSSDLGFFYTSGFQEDFNARKDDTFTDDEYASQTDYVLSERMNLLRVARDQYEEGLLFFYFSSTDLKAHIFWWDGDEPHPTRSPEQVEKNFEHIKDIYRKADKIVGDILHQYGEQATILVMSDHGFCNFRRQFNLNTWLRENGYLFPADCKSIYDANMDWTQTKAYGLGLNGLYLNLQGRERDGIVTAAEREALLQELSAKLEAVKDQDGQPVIRKVYHSDTAYVGTETKLAPDLLIGYHRGYRGSWETGLGNLTEEVLYDNDNAWSGDHCVDPDLVPGVLFSNKPIHNPTPALTDLAPTILAEFALEIPESMTGKPIF